ncbi:(2Fe-2S)-binding protein [Cupriavidus necator]|uniref:(2Fe-2S)-binding protein n=1 Tax=Cupriavidus necator TaxID=106590 RepID=UPI0005B3777F|nr:(2Fe-2S)-binding protein [Cupriavidus necator]
MPTAAIHLTVNGTARDLTVDTRATLADTLRDALGLTGTKVGCNRGECGTCTVHVDGRRVLGCMMLAVMAHGHTVRTIEGLAPSANKLHALQRAFLDHDALQCGYCTAGQVMSALACVAEGHAGSADEVRAWMSGNLCRCGAYPNIVEAVLDYARDHPGGGG